jgi:hypothetical protein
MTTLEILLLAYIVLSMYLGFKQMKEGKAFLQNIIDQNSDLNKRVKMLENRQ